MGVPEENGGDSLLPLFTESVATLGLTTGTSDTPPIPERVHHAAVTSLCGETDHPTHRAEADNHIGETRIGRWSSHSSTEATHLDGW